MTIVMGIMTMAMGIMTMTMGIMIMTMGILIMTMGILIMTILIMTMVTIIIGPMGLKMKKEVVTSKLVTLAFDNLVLFQDCPYGFFYAGEIPQVKTRGEIWEMGETSPVYSCYSVQGGNMDWVTANQM